MFSYTATTTLGSLHMVDSVRPLSQGFPLDGQAFMDCEQFGKMLQIEIEVLSLDQLLNLSFQ
ncbi:hypothetical protein AKG76_23105 [Vibrio parahaemolyticus]|nr:hypothetical protein AKG76_23105 [Vibrio parahaemolyticus]